MGQLISFPMCSATSSSLNWFNNYATLTVLPWTARCCPRYRDTAMTMTAMHPDLMKLKIYIKEIYGFKNTQAPISLCHMEALLQCLFHNEPYPSGIRTLKWHSLPTKKF